MTMAHDLLVEPALSWRDRERRRSKTTLPGLLARLASRELGDFPRLRAHQLHPWCMFLTQLAALALRRAGIGDPKQSDSSWRELLLALTDGAHEPWCLVVDDLSRPAFFQPPVPEGSIGTWKSCDAPDDIDVLVTTRAHDVKTSMIRGDDVESWVYALATLQTMQGFPGRGYNGIARMNGGYGSRSRVGLAPSHRLGERFLRDLYVLLASWPGLLARGYRDDGAALVWCEPWDGTKSLAIDELAPHFIEVCWRVRCLNVGESTVCAYTTTQARRCLSDVKHGDVGDCWIPIKRGKGEALSVGARGFDYQLLVQLLFDGDFEPGSAQVARAEDGDTMLFMAAALARGQGKTDGLHERVLTLPPQVRVRLGRPDTRASLAMRASARVIQAEKMRTKVLFPALKQLALGAQVIDDDLHARVDDCFFDHLFATLELPDEEARLSWDEVLRGLARLELQRAISRSCLADAQRLRAIAAAESMFETCLRKTFPDLFSTVSDKQGATT